jgi:predicted transcriptional regulator of viral defense system
VLKMLEADPRIWRVSEIISALRQERDHLPQVANLDNAVRTVVSDATKAGEIERVALGEYRVSRPPTVDAAPSGEVLENATDPAGDGAGARPSG